MTEMILEIFVLVVSVVLVILTLTSSWASVGKDEYMVLNWRIPFMPGPKPGHFIAVGTRQGIQAKVYTSGIKFIWFVQISAEINKKLLREIPEGKYGVIVAKDGIKPPVGKRLIAEKIVHCDNYSNGEKFLLNGGQRGIQISPPLPPGRYAINEFLFDIILVDPTKIEPQKKLIEVAPGVKQEMFVPQIGLVTLNVGKEIPQEERKNGRILAKIIEGHDSFQNLADFMEPQVVNSDKETSRKNPTGECLEKGQQLGIIPPGAYVHIGKAVEIQRVDVPYIREGQVGVLISSVGVKPKPEECQEKSIPIPGNIQIQSSGKRTAGYVLKEDIFTLENPLRGILPVVINPGFVSYEYANIFAFSIVTVDTTQITVDLSSKEEFAEHKHEQPAIRLDPVMLVTKDGHTVPLSAELILNISREQAPWVVAIAGSQKGLINDVVVPFLFDISGRVVSNRTIKDLVEKRDDIRLEIEKAIGEGLRDYPIDLVAFRIRQFNFEKSPDVKTRQYVDILAEQRNVEEEKNLVARQTELQEIRKGFKLAEATADNQNILARANVQKQAAGIQKEVIETRKEAFIGVDPLTAAIADPDAIPGLVTAVAKTVDNFFRDKEEISKPN